MDYEKIKELYLKLNKRPFEISKEIGCSKEELIKYLKETDLYNLRVKQKSNRRRSTNLQKYGVDNPAKSLKIQNKIKSTNLQRYGTESHLSNINIRSKINTTNLQKYGGAPAKSKEVVKKMKNTNLQKYGVDCTLKNQQIQKKMKENNLIKYKTEWAISSKIVKDKIRISRYRRFGASYNNLEKLKNTNLQRYGVPYFVMTNKCRKLAGTTISKNNKKFSKFLDDNDIKTEFEFSIKRFSYDLHILNTKILIELNPTYTHNSSNNKWFNNHCSKPKDKYYHYNKTKVALDNGYICIHKFDWNSDEEILTLIKNINNYKPNQNEPQLHWYNRKTKEHLIDNEFIKEEMLSKGFVEIYDDGTSI